MKSRCTSTTQPMRPVAGVRCSIMVRSPCAAFALGGRPSPHTTGRGPHAAPCLTRQRREAADAIVRERHAAVRRADGDAAEHAVGGGAGAEELAARLLER